MGGFSLSSRVLKEGSNQLNYAHIAQSVEHFLGKEEVTGSNPVMGSMPVMNKCRASKPVYCYQFKRKRDFILGRFNVQGKI